MTAVQPPPFRTARELSAALGVGLRALRIRADLRQEDIADKAGIALSAVKRLERGEGSTVESLMKFLNALGIGSQAVEWFAPPPTIDPVAIARGQERRQRVRHRIEKSR